MRPAAAPEALRDVLSLLSLDRAYMSLGAAAAGLLAAAHGLPAAQLLYGVLCALGAASIYVLAPGLRHTHSDPAWGAWA